MIKIASDKLNKTNVPFKTKWTCLGLENPLYIEPFTPMSEIVAKLEKITKKTYRSQQISNLKVFYQKFEKIDKNSVSKRRTCLGWHVEYLINDNYVWLVNVKEIKDENFLRSKNFVCIHELYPLIQPVKLIKEITHDEMALELNHKIQTPNIKAFA